MNEKTINSSVIVVGVVALIIGYVLGTARGNYNEPGGRGVSSGVQESTNTQPMRGMMGNGGHMMGETQGTTSSMDAMMRMMAGGLVGKTGDAFDKAFLSEMIPHHQGAVVMAEMVLKTSTRPELRKLAEDIIVAQNKEIMMMQAWKKDWFTSTAQ